MNLVEQNLYNIFYNYLYRWFKGKNKIDNSGYGDGYSRSRDINTDRKKINYRKFRYLYYLSFFPLLKMFYRRLNNIK